MFKNIWRKLSSGQKLTLMGSLLLIFSLFLNWFSDKDVFRSGDTYSALGGPLYLAGFTMLLLAVLSIGLVVLSALRNRRVVAIGTARLGKLQMLAGFSSMYLLMVINSVFFHPRFGLNILEKKTEVGVMLALVATVMVCIGGYLSYRKKFEQEAAAEPSARGQTATEQKLATAPVAATPTAAPVSPAAAAPLPPAAPAFEQFPSRPHVPLNPEPVSATAGTQPASFFSERDPRGKTDYERSKLYENLKKTMVRDTLSPEQRRKLREKEAKENAFSANFGKGGPVVVPTAPAKAAATVGAKLSSQSSRPAQKPVQASAPAENSNEKKPQMYRMDL